eukprot:scaffold6052_cov118-Cylindrotheca_fusiformis.AAC.20
MASGAAAVAPGEESKSGDNGGKWANGTLLYWKFDNGNSWGSIKGHKDGIYSTSWSDGDVHELDEDTISTMVYHAQETLINIPDHFFTGTRVHKYFESEGGWWSGKIVDRDSDHNYTIEWSDGRLEQWNALFTVAMVQDAKDFPIEEGESNEGGEEDSSVDSSRRSVASDSTSAAAEHSERSTTEDVNDEDHTSVTSDGEDALFPGSFPQTEEGLQDFLNYVDGNTQENGHHEEQFQDDAVYQANLRVQASQRKEIPIPVLVPNSLVEWAIRIDEYDIQFGLRRKSYNQDDSEEVEVIVEQHYVYARDDESVVQEEQSSENSKIKVDPTEKGEFYVEDSMSSIILEFDNSYSWITEKAVSYHVRIIPPLPPSIADRAEKSFPIVAKALEQAKYEVAFSQKAVAAAKQNIAHTDYRFKQIDHDIDSKQHHLKQIKQTVRGLDERRAVEAQKLQAQRKRLADKTLYIQKLEEAMRELEKERQLCWREKQRMENSIYDQERQLILFDDKCKQVNQEAEELNIDLCDLQIEVLMKENHVADVEKALEKAKADEEEANRHFEFMQRVADALKKRMN